MNEKQQQLIFDKGITNVPSDHICSDNALADASNLIYNNGQHHVIQKPAPFISSTAGAYAIPTLLYIHKFNDQERYIGYIRNGNEDIMCWGTVSSGVYTLGAYLERSYQAYVYYTEGTKVTSVGKTLVIANDTGLNYFLWKTTSYLSLGSTIPTPEVQFKMDYPYFTSETVNTDGIVGYEDGVKTIYNQSAWNDCVIGLYSKLRNQVWRHRAFHGSFMVRVALELYDGTFYYVGNPILMVNIFHAYGAALHTVLIGPGLNVNELQMNVDGAFLCYKWNQDYSNWSDIVRGVVLFVTREANVLDTTGDAIFQDPPSAEENNPWYYYMQDDEVKASTRILSDTYSTLVLRRIQDSEIKSTLESGVYYKLADIGLKGDNSWHQAAKHFEDHTIENITTQTQLGEDDYFSHCPMKAGIVYPYNSRLNLASVQRGFFEGFDNFMPFTTPRNRSANPSSTYTFVVTISTDSGDYQVKHSKSTTQIQGLYFFYPDNRARHVQIWNGTNRILNADLTEHPTLHGAYYFAGVSKDMDEPTGSPEDIPSGDNGQFEILPNYVITSEVNNPFVFKAEGYNKVGTGKIIGLSTTTMALSQDAYGRTDLMVFSDSGIWGMAVDRTGLFSSIHPFSREVCNNPRSITPTDGAIFFASAKGLMMATDAGVKCVSTQLSGKTTNSFIEYMKTAFIAYDYRDSLLWLLNRSSTYNGYHYVYAIRSGAFSKAYLPNVSNALNNYPDYLVQTSAGVFSMAERKDINEDTNTYTASLVSRPLKLENAIALKSIMQAKHIIDLSANASIEWMVEASNNTKTWVQLTSLRGIPWKYYRFTYTFFSLAATDTFSGTILITQERRTNRMR